MKAAHSSTLSIVFFVWQSFFDAKDMFVTMGDWI